MVQTATLPLMLKQLNLSSIARHWQAMLDQAERNGWNAAQYLSALCEQELADRHSRRIARYGKESHLPVGKSLASFDFAEIPSLDRRPIEALAGSTDWTRQARNVLLFGASGVGKTHLAVGLGVKAVEQGFSAQFYRFDELLTALKADAHVPPARLRRKKYLSTALLIIDEMGFEPMDREEASLFFRLVTYRYGRGSILITTNKSVRDWTELLAGDEVLTAAILDRLLHNAHVINIKRRSYRLRDLDHALGEQRERT